MPAFYRATLLDFLGASESELLGRLSLAHAEEGFAQQRSDATTTWYADLGRLREALGTVYRMAPDAAQWTVLLEFVIPRKAKRVDVVILIGETIVVLEQKSAPPTKEDCLQAEEYALLLHYFHRPSKQRKIVTLVVSPSGGSEEPTRQQELDLQTAAFWIAPVKRVRWDRLAERLVGLALEAGTANPVDGSDWDAGEYFPVPTIIEAARSLHAGLGIREIAHSRAAKHDIEELTANIQGCILRARETSAFVICFVTGVPGSGKTLVGLNLAFSSRTDRDAIHFMSGNGPLVSVLQAVFAENQARVHGFRALDARMHAKTLIENVHQFAKTYTEETPGAVPSNHVVIFDEAQRAWDAEQSQRKFAREHSEPEMLLGIMGRHTDWAVVIALVGGGQEINDGEAGLGEWGRALARSERRWEVHASPDALDGGESVAGGRLFEERTAGALMIVPDERLHLRVSVRSLKAENYARWVNCVVDGQAEAAAVLNVNSEFPVMLTRSLGAMRQKLRQQMVGFSRCGLAGSSKAMRLRAEGLEPDANFHGGYDWDKWYLAPASDVRSSAQLEVYASEFEIQGLELDWIGLCWGGDFVWSAEQKTWLTRKFRNAAKSGWTPIRSATQQGFRRNAYRVLLTRARQGLVIYVPEGDAQDSTRSPREFDEIAAFLLACGVRPVDASPGIARPADPGAGPLDLFREIRPERDAVTFAG